VPPLIRRLLREGRGSLESVRAQLRSQNIFASKSCVHAIAKKQRLKAFRGIPSPRLTATLNLRRTYLTQMLRHPAHYYYCATAFTAANQQFANVLQARQLCARTNNCKQHVARSNTSRVANQQLQAARSKVT
jgi:hypothetical protein